MRASGAVAIELPSGVPCVDPHCRGTWVWYSLHTERMAEFLSVLR